MKTFKAFIKEQEVNREFKTSSQDYKRAQTNWTNDVIRGKPTTFRSGSEFATGDTTPEERVRINRTAEINTLLKTAAPIKGLIDARTNKPYVPPVAEKLPLTGPVVKGSANPEGKGDLIRPASPIKTDPLKKTTTVYRSPSPL